MKYSTMIFFIAISFIKANSQDTFYDYVKFGEFQVNYTDTIIYDNEIHYDQYNYNGEAPIFVQIWYPTIGEKKNKELKLGDFHNENIPVELTQVYEKLTAQMDEIFIRDGITYDIESDEPINYDHLTNHEILQKIKLIQTKSYRSQLDSKLDFPVIVYHHGSQGLSYENSIMAEFFASKGYVFLSSNFHLPYKNTIYGLLPYSLEKETKHNQSGARKLIEFAKSITTLNKVFFIGHSWGAQEGWCFLNDSTLTDGFVSMETTLEYNTDTVKSKERWPYVYNALKVKKNKFSEPILLLAAQDDNLNFDFFKDLSTEKMIYASYKKPFAHNSYTSTYLMRYFLKSEINQPDSEILHSQIIGYAAHLQLISEFLESVQKNSQFEYQRFENDFSFK